MHHTWLLKGHRVSQRIPKFLTPLRAHVEKKKKHRKADPTDPQVLPPFEAQGLSDPISQSRMDPCLCLCCIRPWQVMDCNPPIIPVLQHAVLCCLAFFSLFKMWPKQISKPLAVRWMRFPLLWTVPCTQSIFHCESSYLFPCLLAFWPPSASAFLLPSLCFPSSPPALAALLSRWSTWPARLVGAAWHPFPHLANRMHRRPHRLLFSGRTFWLLPALRWLSTSL